METLGLLQLIEQAFITVADKTTTKNQSFLLPTAAQENCFKKEY
jgi:hypothetical protein